MPDHAPTTPNYSRTPRGDLYELFTCHFGVEATALHQLMEAIQSLYRAPFNGQYHADLEKAHALVARLLGDIVSCTPSAPPRGDAALVADGVLPPPDPARVVWPRGQDPMPLDEMATILSATGWLVREGPLDQAAWQQIGQQEGYFPACSVYDSAVLADVLQRRGYEVIAPAPGDTFPIAPLAAALRNGAFSAGTPSGITVLTHCLGLEISRQDGGWDTAHIRARLAELGVPPQGLWTDHQAEVGRLEARWSETTQEVQP